MTEENTSLCAGRVITKSGPTTRELISLPLEQRLEKMLTEGPHVHRFSTIKHMAALDGDDEEKILTIVHKHATLVQGVWVGKSEDRYTNRTEILGRSYVILLFTESRYIKDSELNFLGYMKSAAIKVLGDIALEKQGPKGTKGWEFREQTDSAFLQNHPRTVDQERDKIKSVRDILIRRITEMTTLNVSQISASTEISKDAQEAVSKILGQLLSTHQVCSIWAIRKALLDAAGYMSELPDARIKDVAAALKQVVRSKLPSFINEHATNVYGVCLLKSSSNKPELNRLRTAIIKVFSGKEPCAAVMKSEIMEVLEKEAKKDEKAKTDEKEAKTDEKKTKTVVTEAKYLMVMKEYCECYGGAWTLKSGDELSESAWKSILEAVQLLHIQ